MTGPEFPVFSSARAGWTVQLADYEGGWQESARLLEDPVPCRDDCGALTAPGVLPSGKVLPQHAHPHHPMRVLSRESAPGIPASGDEESANQTPDIRGGEPLTPEEELRYRDEQADDLRDGRA